ncbi:hypothetical protein EUX98_g4773 [Antrodiella citrinella]|uniref:Uncharacterized protein n=1 Tax=Antrodiella citrinella TaxID=2447956 RepID=A0A4V3XIK4_9APHY|nr:hypothetical protein EUX98_g4773 [Antrodiella citrinella]
MSETDAVGPLPGHTTKNWAVIGGEGWRIVEPDESVVFFSFGPDSKVQLELAIIHDIGTGSSELLSRAGLPKLLMMPPNHPGKMAQFGINTGPCHARSLGWAKSFTRKLSDDAKAAKDEEVISASSIVWSLLTYCMPVPITEHIEKVLAEEGLPRAASANVPPGTTFTIKWVSRDPENPLPDLTFKYERGPPEVYLSRVYSIPVLYHICLPLDRHSHFDKNYAKWALILMVKCEVADSCTMPDGGASFVDVNLKVIVRQATGTGIAFQPDHMHGTTKAHGATSWSISHVFSQRVVDMIRDASDAVHRE